jgi:hypothetical protein
MKKRTTIIIDKTLWDKFKIQAIEEGKTASQLLEELMVKEMKGGKS